MLLSKYKKEIEDLIRNWFNNHPKERRILDTFVAKNNLEGQNLGIIILKMPEDMKIQFHSLIKRMTELSAKIISKEGLI